MAGDTGDPLARKTGLQAQVIDRLLRWYARQPREVQLRAANEDELVDLVKRVREVRSLVEHGKKKSTDDDLDQLGELETIRMQQLRQKRRKKHKLGQKAQRIEKRRALIERLRGQGYGWYTIAQYLTEYAQLNVTPSYLRRACLSLGIERENEEVDGQE